jgi:hypothetical protein
MSVLVAMAIVLILSLRSTFGLLSEDCNCEEELCLRYMSCQVFGIVLQRNARHACHWWKNRGGIAWGSALGLASLEGEWLPYELPIYHILGNLSKDD